jgi:hypothetical protein
VNRQLRFDLIQRGYALIWTENGSGPFVVLNEDELDNYLTFYYERKIKIYVFIRAREK